MKLIIPTTITDSLLTSTNVDEIGSSSLAEWDSGTTYFDGDFAYVVEDPDSFGNGTELSVYESLQDANTNKDPETETTWWVFRSTIYAEYNSGTTYDSGDWVTDEANNKIYESQQAANTGNAVTDTDWWLEVGATEPWKAFDAKVGSQVERSGTIYYELTPGSVEGIAFFNLDASSIDIVLTDSVDGEVYNETIELISTDNVVDGYTYCFAPVLFTRSVVVTDLPPYASATLEITINADADSTVAKCGEIVMGRVIEFGATQYGAGFEIVDYSRKAVDAYGNYSVTERAFSKRVPLDVIINNAAIAYLKRTLEDYRATPVVCVPTEDTDLAGPFLTYGYYRTARVVVPYPNYSILTIEWEGLT
jgi:hypothetical protein